jgi:hypothetical protein
VKDFSTASSSERILSLGYPAVVMILGGLFAGDQS